MREILLSASQDIEELDDEAVIIKYGIQRSWGSKTLGTIFWSTCRRRRTRVLLEIDLGGVRSVPKAI